MDQAPPPEPHRDILSDIHAWPADVEADVPHYFDTLPDGSETIVFGDVGTFADHAHQQGDNPYGYQGTCGLCSCEGVLRQFGLDVTEADVVRHAVENGLCQTDGSPAARGGTTLEQQARLLGDFGVPAHTEQATSLEDLASHLEEGRGVIIAVNAGVLWDDGNYYEAGRPNHAALPIGAARDPLSGRLQGFYLNDSGSGEAARFVDAATMADAWLHSGGGCVVTDRVRVTGATPSERIAQ